MKLSDLLNADDLFHPNVFYDGDWVLGGGNSANAPQEDYLMWNAKKVDGKNCYQEFLEKYYYKSMKDILDSSSLAHAFFPKIVLAVDERVGKRVVRFSITHLLYQQFTALLSPKESMKKFELFMEEHQTEEEWINFLKQELKLDRKKFTEVQKEMQQSIYYSQVYQQYVDYTHQTQSPISFDDFLESKILTTTKLVFGTRYYSSFFTKEVPIEPLLQAFDYDLFFLVAARSSLDNCELTDQTMHSMNNSIGYVKLYLDAVHTLRKDNPMYNCSMICSNPQTGHHKKISIDDIQKTYEFLLAKHPEFHFICTKDFDVDYLLRNQGLAEEDIQNFDTGIKSNQGFLLELLKQALRDKELMAEWEFIPRGKTDSRKLKVASSLEKSSLLTEDEKIRRMVIGREHLENSPYIYKIYGIHKFQGYIGYIYSNGSVIFEKYYENITTKRVSSASATYVMNLYNFFEMSRLSKTEIIRIIHLEASSDVQRIFHRENMERWKSEINQVIHGNDYTEEVIHYMDSLIGHAYIQKDKVK